MIEEEPITKTLKSVSTVGERPTAVEVKFVEVWMPAERATQNFGSASTNKLFIVSGVSEYYSLVFNRNCDAMASLHRPTT